MIASMLIAATPAALVDAAIFERVELTEDLSVIAFGVIEDTRCAEPKLCFKDDRLIVAAVVSYRGFDSEVAMELGEPIFLEDGSLTLTDTATPASENGAIQLKKYQLEFVFEPYIFE